MSAPVEKRIRLSQEQAQHLSHLAQRHQISEDQVITQALDMIFLLADFLDRPNQLSRSAVASQIDTKSSENTSVQVPSEEDFKQHLREVGLLAAVETPGLTEPARDRTPIQVKGQPLSRMIIEERR
jgi:hypothetical protein